MEKGAGPVVNTSTRVCVFTYTPSHARLFVSADELIGPLSEAEFVEDKWAAAGAAKRCVEKVGAEKSTLMKKMTLKRYR